MVALIQRPDCPNAESPLSSVSAGFLQLRINALVDLEGSEALEKKIAAVKMILQ
jgi:hypothetical protein